MSKLEYSKGTDSEHSIKLDPKLVSMMWRDGVAYAGGKAFFEVTTAFVGNGAKIKATGKSAKGKKLGKINGKMLANRFVDAFDIPEDMDKDDKIYFDIDISGNSLSGTSEMIPVQPVVRVSNMKWSEDIARRGDVLKLTADVKGIKNGTEVLVTIFEYDRDSSHDKIVSIPSTINDEKLELEWEYEYHEDTDEIPSQEEMERYGSQYNPPEYFFTIKIGGKEYGREQESGLLEFKDWIELELYDDDGNPRADEDYKIIFADGSEQEGKLDSEGKVRLEDIPPGGYRVFFPKLGEE